MGFIVMVVSGIFGILLLVYGVQSLRKQEKNWRVYTTLILGLVLLCFAIYLFNPFPA
jgi:multisubunit Na+/H+ antiporter MnhB subunit